MMMLHRMQQLNNHNESSIGSVTERHSLGVVKG